MGEEEVRSDSHSSHDRGHDGLHKQPPDAVHSADQGISSHLTPLESSNSGNWRCSQSQAIYSSWEVASQNCPSTTFLGPSESPVDERRRLLLIYIHGFMGAETSFQKFPAHVHNLVTNTLAESHVVYSKVYPRYKSRRAMNIARDDFSEWLQPHESEWTDVILLGHSLGGILGAEVALSETESTNSLDIFKHRILGLINFDVPFLGMHPGVVGTGLVSLFQPKRNNQSPPHEIRDNTSAAEAPGSASTGSSQLPGSSQSYPSWFQQNPDSNYDPSFPNDIHRVKRSQLDGFLHFFKKNTGQVTSAMRDYATSYFEFGGCLADYSGLRRRYARLKELEAVDNMDLKRDSHGRLLQRIRFVNYYTASPGFPKDLSSENIPRSQNSEAMDETKVDGQQDVESPHELTKSSSPGVAVDTPKLVEEEMNNLDPISMNGDEDTDSVTLLDEEQDVSKAQSVAENKLEEEFTWVFELLPPLPIIPPVPSAIDPSVYKDKDVLKHAQKEYKRLLNLHEQAKKELDKTIKERRKLLEYLKKKKKRHSSSPPPSRAVESTGENMVDPIIDDETPDNTSQINFSEKGDASSATQLTNIDKSRSSSQTNISEKPPKDRKFCVLPPKTGGKPDPLWVRLFIPDVDEVIAHQSIFLPNGLYYEWLVGDTAARIEQWVQDDCTRRVIWEHLGEQKQ